jgi:cobalt-zinc-cadmium efflux system membrane fusion protein
MSREDKQDSVVSRSRRDGSLSTNLRVRSNRWLVIVAVSLAVLAVALILFFARSRTREGQPVPAPSAQQAAAPSIERPAEVVITLSADELESAQIKTEVAIERRIQTEFLTDHLRTTGTVQSNAYKEVAVLGIAGGIVKEVSVGLGDRVRRGQQLAVIFSAELADAQGEYLKSLAELEEHHKHHRRAAELVEIGAISREEFEQAESAYKSAQARVSSARQRLMLFGMSPKEIDELKGAHQVRSLISVMSPSSGTIINRAVNPGEVIAVGKEMFRIADLSTVWVIGQVYEKNFAAVRVGTPAQITTPSYPGKSFSGRVSYIDPRVDPQTRTAQVRIEVANPSGVLKLGMFVDVSFGAAVTSSDQPVVVIPRAALQVIGTKQVVFVATDRPGTFVQREVVTGSEANGLVPIYSGVKAGERVVTEGSFLLRAESLKINPAQIGP